MSHLPKLLLLAIPLSLTSCSYIINDLLFDRKSSKDRRAEQYEDRGFSKKRASRLAAEDDFWSNDRSPTPIDRHQWENPTYPD